MTDREDIKNMVNAIIAAHEIKEFQKHDELKEELQRALIAARDSVPGSLSKILHEIKEGLKENNEKLASLEIKVSPLIDIVDVAGKLRKGTLWISAFLVGLTGIIASVIHIKNTIR